MKTINLVNWLKLLFGGLSLYMLYLVIDTSIKSDLFEVLPALNAQPWFNTTIIDFYILIAVLSAWVIYKEKTFLRSFIWIAAFVFTGSIAVCLYVFLQLCALKQGDSLDKIVLKN